MTKIRTQERIDEMIYFLNTNRSVIWDMAVKNTNFHQEARIYLENVYEGKLRLCVSYYKPGEKESIDFFGNAIEVFHLDKNGLDNEYGYNEFLKEFDPI
ncbi:MAG: hypothetical protein GYA14_14180, partial [Ignavibacteria bacterium]|nr:hypothetical protein [Ignavibacteria bacterium]